MITTKGKDILGKYLIGQAPAYASYIAVGCGAKPLEPYVSGAIPDYSEKKSLDFEMFRVPISSRGFVDDNGVSKIVFTAELPTEERYEITEVGIYSAGFNSAAGTSDSKNIYAFTSNESWKINGANSIDSIAERLDTELVQNVIRDTFNNIAKNIFQTNADNQIFTYDSRMNKNERCRFLNNMIIMRGNSSTISGAAKSWVGSGNFIQLSSTSADFSKNSPLDEIKLAFSIIKKDATVTSVENKVCAKVLVEFSSSSTPGQYSRFEAEVNHDNTSGSTYNLNENRYFVITKNLQDLTTTSGLLWKSVDTVKIYSQVLTGSSTANTVSDKYYIGLDALRLENKTSENSLYGLTGYSVIRSVGALPIIKSTNTSNYIEFRFAMDVG